MTGLSLRSRIVSRKWDHGVLPALLFDRLSNQRKNCDESPPFVDA